MTWLYLNWLILLVGSSIAFYRQYPEYLMAKTHSVALNNRDREQLALNILMIIGNNFYARSSPVSIESIVDELACPKQSVEEVLQCYQEAGILHQVDNKVAAYSPAIPLEGLTVSEAYKAIRTSYAIFSPIVRHNSLSDLALPIMQRIEQSVDRELGELTIKQLIEMNASVSN